VLSSTVPHLVKKVVDRKRPDRMIPVARRNSQGIPKSGRPFDAFPSGHAVHVAAVAASCGRGTGARTRALLWTLTAGVGASRILILAHSATDVVAGWCLGWAIERLVFVFHASFRVARGQPVSNQTPSGSNPA
jgi:undecaprenyl-diphosphatase